MKRFALLALVAVFVLGTFGTAMAETEVSFSGSYQATFQWYKSTVSLFQKDAGDDTFWVNQRIRYFINAATSETNKAVLGFEMDGNWGNTAAGRNNAFGLNGDEAALEVKRGLLQFVVPNTQLTVISGLQGLSMPDAIGNSQVFNGDAAALAAVYPFADNLTATGAWIRAVDDQTNDGAGMGDADEVDAAALILNWTPVEGFNIQPYYVNVWSGSGNTVTGSGTTDEDGYWFGAAMALTMFDPLTIAADFDYGSVDGATSARDVSGWMTDILVTYKMDMFTPGLLFHYATGQDEDATNGSEIMPSINCDSDYGVTNLGTAGGRGRSSDGLLNGLGDIGANGFEGGGDGGAGGKGVWALGGLLQGISLVENLTTDLALVYYKGTGDEAIGGTTAGTLVLTDEDSAWEINVNNTYAMYEELSLLVDFGYVSVDLDSNVHGTALTDAIDQDAYKFMIGLEYSF